MYEPSPDRTRPQKPCTEHRQSGKRPVGENPEYKQLSSRDI